MFLQIKIILASSEHSFPFRLSSDMNFNCQNFSSYIFAGEIAPNKMYQLLTTQWGVKENLALALIDIYGGHILDAVYAINGLSLDREKFVTTSVWNDLGNNISCCLRSKDGRTLDTLMELAKLGYVSLPDWGAEDPIIKNISENNVGSVINSSAKVIGLDDQLLKSSDEYGLIPNKQSMRLLIAKNKYILHYSNRNHTLI